MEHNIAARYAARPVARFVRPGARDRDRRLGLRSSVSFRAATRRATVLRTNEPGPLARLRASGRGLRPAHGVRPTTGRPRPAVTMRWATFARRGPDLRSSAAPAPWRA
ncbi:MAG TPA: hypothetical protein VH720_04875 [Candidatus Limnocylindrales bacterium]